MSLVVVASYREPYAAHLARATLESEGIPVFLTEENLIGVQWLYSQAIGGVKVQVPEQCAEAAIAILSEDRSSDLGATSEAEIPLESGDLCPECGSASVSIAPLERRSKALSLLLNIPFGIHRNYWRCESCSHEWHVPNPNYAPIAILGCFVGFLLYLWERLVRFVFWLARPAYYALISRWRSYHCWSCDTPYRSGTARCPGCGIELPDAVASSELIVRGRHYDGKCPACHTPYARDDYLPTSPVWFCSRCKRPIPGAGS